MMGRMFNHEDVFYQEEAVNDEDVFNQEEV